MKRFLSSAIVVLMLALGAHSQTAPDTSDLTKLLKEFLDGASRNDAAVHERFWAEELVYTGSNGRRRNRADVMHDVRSTPAPKPGDPTMSYAAEDIRIQQYGETAIVAFRLVGTTRLEEKTQTANYLNTGTFLKRKGQWQVVAWQATKMATPEDEAKKDVATAEAAFQQAMRVSDSKALEGLVDESFIWTQKDGTQVTRKLLLDQIASGELKYSRLETSNVTISVHGDSAVVRGVSPRQRSHIPRSQAVDTTPFNAFYTLTFVNKGGVWKIVAMHSSRV